MSLILTDFKMIFVTYKLSSKLKKGNVHSNYIFLEVLYYLIKLYIEICRIFANQI